MSFFAYVFEFVFPFLIMSLKKFAFLIMSLKKVPFLIMSLKEFPFLIMSWKKFPQLKCSLSFPKSGIFACVTTADFF